MTIVIRKYFHEIKKKMQYNLKKKYGSIQFQKVDLYL